MTHTVWQRSNVTPLYLSIVRKLTLILESDDASFDEPVRETIMRDLREVAHKFRHVIAPQKEVCFLTRNIEVTELEFDVNVSYRAGPLMIVIIFMQGTIYDCKQNRFEDQI